MSSVITFSNHSPIRVADADLIETVWSSGQDFGHHLLKRYVTKQGKAIYWASYNSGRCYNGRSPDTSRTYLPNVSEIKEYFTRCELDHTYHAEVEAKVDEASIIDVTRSADRLLAEGGAVYLGGCRPALGLQSRCPPPLKCPAG
jgi:hypothetical protein